MYTDHTSPAGSNQPVHPAMHPIRRIIRIVLVTGICVYGGLLIMLATIQRQFIFFPSHHTQDYGLTPWKKGTETIGFIRQTASPKAIWLMMHGNAGQAADRSYALPSFPADDTVYLLEYPGYGQRQGSPSRESFDAAALDAYLLLRSTFPSLPVCVVGESIGSGVASFLATQSPPPNKVVLIVPYDRLANVAAKHIPILPVRWMLYDDWDNIASLRDYRGPIEIFAALQDEIIPFVLAKNLASHLPQSTLHAIDGRHNDWSIGSKVRFAAP